MKEKRTRLNRAMLALCLVALCWISANADVMTGDVDGNGSVNIADVTELIDYLLCGDASAINLANADCDRSGTVNIADVTELIDHLLYGVWSVHDWVDLGLPSGTLWATCNVGANTPEDYGDYFAWGETESKETYNWSTYKWCNGTYNTLTKYCTRSSYGDNGFTDGKTELDPEDDAAYVNWGAEWRMPTLDQIEELLYNCTWTWTTQNRVNGMLITGPNGNTLFLPAAGDRLDDSLRHAGYQSSYWSRTLYSFEPSCADYLLFYSERWYWGISNRGGGFPVRAVRVSQN